MPYTIKDMPESTARRPWAEYEREQERTLRLALGHKLFEWIAQVIGQHVMRPSVDDCLRLVETSNRTSCQEIGNA